MAGTKLLPCPFCGGEARTSSKDYGDTHYWRVFCDTPSCAMCMTGVFHYEAEAIEAWNTRAGCDNCAALNKAAGLWAKADKRARNLERTCRFIKYPDNYPYETDDGYCSECHELMYEHYAYCPSCGAKVVSE